MNTVAKMGWILALLGLVGGALFHVAQSRRLVALEAENAQLRADNRELPRLREESREARRLKVAQDELERLRKDNVELHRLRGQYVELQQLREDYRQLQANAEALRRQVGVLQSRPQQSPTAAPGPTTTPTAPTRRGAWLGIGLMPVNQSQGGAAPPGPASGLVVLQILPNSPAAEAGLRSADVVTAIDGKPVGSMDDVRNELATKEPGSAVSLEVVRNGQSLRLPVSTAPWPQ